MPAAGGSISPGSFIIRWKSQGWHARKYKQKINLNSWGVQACCLVITVPRTPNRGTNCPVKSVSVVNLLSCLMQPVYITYLRIIATGMPNWGCQILCDTCLVLWQWVLLLMKVLNNDWYGSYTWMPLTNLIQTFWMCHLCTEKVGRSLIPSPPLQHNIEKC